MSQEYKIKGYGWKPSLPDHRNVPADTSGLPILDEVDPRNDMPLPYDQGQLGSCTGNAIAGAKEYNDILDGKHTGTPSRLFIYYEERKMEGSVSQDAGAYGHDGFKVLRREGAPPETLWPYDINRFAEKPPTAAYDEAKNHKVPDYRHPAPNIDVFKQIFSNKQTIAFGFTVYQSFETQKVADTGIVPMPSSREQILGGHEPLAVGYLKNEPDYALVRNSWSFNWGLGGYFLMPWKYLLSYSLAGDWRTIYRPQSV